jgi:hypothetical protein
MIVQVALIVLAALTVSAAQPVGMLEVWEQTPPVPLLEEEVADQAEAPEKAPFPLPRETPGYFPRGRPPSPITSLELSSINTAMGPVTGVLAPYGNTADDDTLWRSWNFHKLGPLNLAPFLEYDGIYRTNVLHTFTDKKSDFVHAVNPGLRLELPLAQRHKISLGYLGNYFIFSRLSNLSHYDHNVRADALLNFRGGLTLNLVNAFRAATEEPSAENSRKRPYYRYTPYVQATYRFADKWRVQGFYQFDLLNFKDNLDRSNDYREQGGGLTFFYKFWPKTSALVQYIITSRTFPDSSGDDSIIHTPLIGVTCDPTAKISGTAKFGYSLIEYRQTSPGRNHSPNSFVVSVQALYRYSRYTNLSLAFQRSKQDDVDFGNRPFWNTGVFVAWSHEWTYFKTTSYASFSFVNNSYINNSLDAASGTFKRRDDTVIFLGAGISRPVTRWCQFRVDYSYINNSSNFGGLTYNEHRVLTGLQTSL